MLRTAICSLLFVSAFTDDFEAGLDAWPSMEHQRLAEHMRDESDSTCDTEEFSLMQRHAHVQEVVKAQKLKSPSLKTKPLAVADSSPPMKLQMTNDKRGSGLENALREAGIDEADLFGEARVAGPAENRVLRERVAVVVALGIIVILCGSIACYLFDPADDDGDPEDTNEEVEVRRNEELPADTMGFLIMAIVRDAESIVKDKEHTHLYIRLGRILIAGSVMLLNMGLQVYLFIKIMTFVVPEAVASIRDTYETFEVVMYDNHTKLSVNGEKRGIDGFFNETNFAKLDDDMKSQVCSMPFSEPWFFIPLMFIWTLSCTREIKNATDMIYMLIVRMPTVDSMAEALESRTQLSGAKTRRELTGGKDLNVKVIQGLTRTVKGIILFCVLLPRMGITCFLCWLGSRWLAAASNFGDLVLDTVAVEFMLLLKNLLYATIVSDRNKRDLHHTEVRPPTFTEKANLWVYISTSLWIFLAAGWVALYCLYFQMVLLEYKWDVRTSCVQWITTNYPSKII